MIDPKDHPDLQKPDHEQLVEKEKRFNQKVRGIWKERMRSGMIRMSRGAQNLWSSIPWPHGDNWRRKNKKK